MDIRKNLQKFREFGRGNCTATKFLLFSSPFFNPIKLRNTCVVVPTESQKKTIKISDFMVFFIVKHYTVNRQITHIINKIHNFTKIRKERDANEKQDTYCICSIP